MRITKNLIYINGATMYEFQYKRLIIKFLKREYINKRNLKIIKIQIDKGE